jgi:Trehalose-6-phosphate synthase
MSPRKIPRPGVLVLSIFAGAAAELTGALLVNPHDAIGMCEALQRALQMPLDARQRRHEINMAALRKNDLGVWRDTFLNDLRKCPCRSRARAAGITNDGL